MSLCVCLLVLTLCHHTCVVRALRSTIGNSTILCLVFNIFSLLYNAGLLGAGVSAEYTGVSNLMKLNRLPAEHKFSKWNTQRIFLYLFSLKGGAFLFTALTKVAQWWPDSLLCRSSPETCVVNLHLQKPCLYNCPGFQATLQTVPHCKLCLRGLGFQNSTLISSAITKMGASFYSQNSEMSHYLNNMK